MHSAGQRHRIRCALIVLCAAAAGSGSACAEQSVRASELRGAWRAEDGALVLFQPDRVITFENGEPAIGAVVRARGDALTLRRGGLLETWHLSRSGGVLSIQRAGKSTAYKALAEIPPQVGLKPLQLPPPTDLPAAQVAEIQTELTDRLKRDQAAIKSKDHARTTAVVSENTAYLEKLVSEVGWIDGRRFGHQAAANAIILAKHSHHLLLFRDAVPAIETDFKHPGDDAEIYSIFYDELMIELGGKQRYGTQLGTDAHGKPLVLPLEDPARVEEWRKDLGLEPLPEYLALASKYLYRGQDIRLPRADE